MDEAALNLHLSQVVTAFLMGNVTPLLGAGVNLTTRSVQQPWKDANSFQFLPDGTELAEHLAAKFRQTDAPKCDIAECTLKDRLYRPDLVKVSQAIQVQQGEFPLLRTLRDIFKAAYPLSLTHRFLARIPKILAAELPEVRHQLIMTTNYDGLMEQAFAAEGQDFDLLWYQAGGNNRARFIHKTPAGEVIALPERPNDYSYPFFEHRPVILKLHGTVKDETGEGSYVITEDDYIEYLSRVDHNALPKLLVGRWINMLYLGYSLRDYNLRVMVRRLRQADHRERVCWTVLKSADPVDVSYWTRNQVEVIQTDLNEYIPRLESALKAAVDRP
jgi:SIR2-like domain